MSHDSPSTFAKLDVEESQVTDSSVIKLLLFIALAVIAMIFLCGGLVVALLMPIVNNARESARRAKTSSQMKMLGVALHYYHDAHGVLPPAYLTDADGNPTLSWRVLLLPYLEESPLYEQFDLSKSWDSPANASLAARKPMIFHKPDDDDLPADRTTFLAIRSPQSLFPGSNPVSLRAVSDGTAATIAFVDSPNQAVVWTAPDDTSPADFIAGYKQSSKPVHIIFADAAVTLLAPNDASDSTIEALITRDGNEPISLPRSSIGL